MTLYLKYRPQKISELDLERVRLELEKIVRSNNLPHAFLFSGPRGAGKTSAARILAKVVNCEKNAKKLAEPCNKCGQCKSISQGTNMDVIELDAASHRGIDDVRALRDRVILSPSSARKKVYIIDEAHMLTTEAANAFLKTLEEPPAHVLFILATTNPEKLPETVRSRLMNVVFTKANDQEIGRQLQRVMKGEKIKAEKGVVELIARASDGSFREAVKILERLTINTKILKEKRVREFLFQDQISTTSLILDFLIQKKGQECLKEIEKLVQSGGSIKTLIQNLIQELRQALLIKQGLGEEERQESFPLNQTELISLIRLLSTALQETGFAFISQLPLELAVVEWCQEEDNSFFKEDKEEKGEEEKKEKTVSGKKKVKIKATAEVQKESVVLNNQTLKEISDQVWNQILSGARNKDSRVGALLRAARPMGFDGQTLKLGVFYQFHKERLETAAIRQSLSELVGSVFGCPVRVICSLTQKPEPLSQKETLTSTEDQDIIQAAKEIFET